MASQHTRSEILDIIERQAERSGIPRDDFLRFAYIETGGRFNPDAHNTGSGAKGLFQFVPSTAAEFNIAGREFDPVANTRAAAELYARNRNDIVNRQARSGHPFLSGQDAPNGLDMYLAHQQGAAGYASIQNAIANGAFTLSGTRRNLMGNISARDFENVTGQPYAAVAGMNDRDLATAFSRYWGVKYAAIALPERGIEPLAPTQPGRERTSPLADGVLQSGERGEEIRALQVQLNQLGFRDRQGAELETRSGIYGPRTAEAVRAFQVANAIEASGAADQATRDAIVRQLALPDAERNRPAQPEPRSGDGRFWPTPGNYQLNRMDIPGEGNPNFGFTRRNADGSPRFHGGIDIEGRRGDPVVAHAGGTVEVRPNNGAAGNTVHVRHDDGTMTKYFHLDRITVANGVRVDGGQPIGTIGDSGNARGLTPHLHFELWRDGRRVDPMPYVWGLREPGREGAPPVREPAAETVLRNGASGAAVRELQEQLNRLGYTGSNGRPLETRSGLFGAQTEHALRAFQSDRGIGVDGAYGPESRTALAATLRERDAQRAAEGAGVVLRQGNRGADVAGLQASLNRLGHTDAQGRPLQEDGIFGDRTRQAVIRFQRQEGLEVDGIAGRDTLTRIGERLPRNPAERVEAEARVTRPVAGDARRDFVERLLASAKGGDDRGVRDALDQYLQTPAGREWQRVAEGQVPNRAAEEAAQVQARPRDADQGR